jgi:flagellin-like hook-associated protein FlgL
MSIAKTNLVNSIATAFKDSQLKIKALESQLISGKKVLTTDQQDTIATLSQTAASYSKPQASITAAQNTIDVAQTGITSIIQLMKQMQQMASLASSPSLNASDSNNFNFRFQKLVTEIGKLATSAKLNGTNLLSGTAGMNVMVGTDKTATSRYFINSVNIFGMMTTGILSGIKLDTAQNAQEANNSLRSAMMQITNGQASLKYAYSELSKKSNELKGLGGQATDSIKSLQDIDPVKVKEQLAQLKSKQNIDYQLISQLDPIAAKTLNIASLTS